MARLSSVRVPKDAGPVMLRLAQLAPEQFNSLRSSLSSPLTRDTELQLAVRDAVPEWTQSDADDFVGHMVSLSALGMSHRFDHADLALAVVDLLPEEVIAELPDGFAERLSAVLSSRGLSGFAKAIDVSREFERLVHLSRTMTDIRPVFAGDPTTGPMGSVIVHTLRLDYFEDGSIHSVSYAMNAKDLRDMIETLQRAEAKAAVLSDSLEKIGWAEYQLTGEADE